MSGNCDYTLQNNACHGAAARRISELHPNKPVHHNYVWDRMGKFKHTKWLQNRKLNPPQLMMMKLPLLQF